MCRMCRMWPGRGTGARPGGTRRGGRCGVRRGAGRWSVAPDDADTDVCLTSMSALRPLHAERSYAAFEALDVVPATLRLTACGDALDCGACGPEEHRIDAFQLRNEAGFINDFRDDVADRRAAKLARRRANCAGLTMVRVHAQAPRCTTQPFLPPISCTSVDGASTAPAPADNRR